MLASPTRFVAQRITLRSSNTIPTSFIPPFPRGLPQRSVTKASARIVAAMSTTSVNAVTDAGRGSITHVIFDMDGLLLDTEKFYTEVQEKILARYNKTFDWSLKAKMMGRKAIEAATLFVEECGISDSLSPEAFIVERESMLQDLFPTSDLMPGASRLLRHLHGKGIPICVATGYLFLHHHHNTTTFRLQMAFSDGPVDPRKALVFEDAPSGVMAAKNAGMNVIMVPDPRLDKSYCTVADQVLASLLHFKPEEWGLPPFEDSQN
ncbi:hypothetical protein YC2023_032044 [Brassica napus]